jgi:glutaminyl-peptide cyclotransferase
MTTARLAIAVALAALIQAAAGGAVAAEAIPVYRAHVVRSYPHDPKAFTEGLFYKGGFLYESTGMVGHSSIRKVRLETGQVLERRNAPADDFGEGIVAWRDRLIQLTWQSGKGYVYDLASFAPRASFRYPGEGWALTHDDRRLIMSDGTPVIRFLDPETLAETGRITVTAEGRPVRNINELEWVKGEIYANIWMTNSIARIDPSNGQVVGWIELGDLAATIHKTDQDQVPNGIAYDSARDRLFVTGKLWPKLFEIRLVAPPGAGSDSGH